MEDYLDEDFNDVDRLTKKPPKVKHKSTKKIKDEYLKGMVKKIYHNISSQNVLQ